jgi:hypothetical protein
MRVFRVLSSALLFVFAFAISAKAHAAKQRISFDFEIAEDRSVVYAKHIETTPLNDAAVQNFAQHRLVVKASEASEILEAYTRTSDGRVIPVDLTQIVTQDGGR